MSLMKSRTTSLHEKVQELKEEVILAKNGKCKHIPSRFVNSSGYTEAQLNGQKRTIASLFLEQIMGMGKDFQIYHICGDKKCVNVSHVTWKNPLPLDIAWLKDSRQELVIQ